MLFTSSTYRSNHCSLVTSIFCSHVNFSQKLEIWACAHDSGVRTVGVCVILPLCIYWSICVCVVGYRKLHIIQLSWKGTFNGVASDCVDECVIVHRSVCICVPYKCPIYVFLVSLEWRRICFFFYFCSVVFSPFSTYSFLTIFILSFVISLFYNNNKKPLKFDSFRRKSDCVDTSKCIL